MHEWAFNDTNPIGVPGSMNSMPSGFGSGVTRMSTYWPNSILQDSLGRLYELIYTVGVGWNFHHLFLTSNFTGVAMLPGGSNAKLDRWNMVFQQSDGVMVNSVGNQTIDYTPGNLKQPIPRGAAIGGFAVPRASDPTQFNSYVLSQADSGEIQMTWTTDGTNWQGPKGFSALKKADKDTNIACLTPSSWPTTNLLPQFDMARCYFQVRGVLREVIYDGKDWKDLGAIPMP